MEPEPNLLRVCRNAARARFLSVLEFVDSLKAQHLTSFWHFSSSPSLTLLISFGNLLLGSALDPEERAFYLTKLKEFRWTLKLNGEAGAKFMKPALAAMMINPDEVCRRNAPDFMVESPGTTVSRSSYNFSPSAGPDVSSLIGQSMSTAIATPMTPWQAPSPGFDNLLNTPMPDMQEYLNAFAWVPPGFHGDQDGNFSGT